MRQPCTECGAPMDNEHHRAKRCGACRGEKKVETAKETKVEVPVATKPAEETRFECSECGALVPLSKRENHEELHRLAGVGAASADMIEPEQAKRHAVEKRLGEENIPFLTTRPKRIATGLILEFGWEAVVPLIEPDKADVYEGYVTSATMVRLAEKLSS